jgi:galactokinase
MGVPKLREADRALLEEFRTQMDDETYRRARHIVTENERVVSTVAAFASGNLQGVGELFAQSQASMKYDFEISTPALDLAVATALSHGAVASRVTGGGFGGAAIAIVPSEQRSLIEARVTESFLQAGLGEPNLFTVQASRGAEREM